MDLEVIKALIAAMAHSGLAEMEFSENGWSLRLVREARRVVPRESVALVARPAVPPPVVAQAPVERDLAAPLAGVVHLQSAPDAPPYVRPGQRVAAGDPVCLIEAMKVFNTVRAECDGIVDAVLVASGVEVTAGQALVRLAG
jgi:acetyl-CoA carboxylase biotin carboxyl carrier protein